MQNISRGSVTPPEHCMTQKIAGNDITERFQTLEFGFKTDQAGLNQANPDFIGPTEDSNIPESERTDRVPRVNFEKMQVSTAVKMNES